ncbi:zinc finger homeobox protein 4 [Caerostris extrusa]|uniref:Zinc finger homeobox protein 4 n=1 Tax=Caerostris extrusa TaxID=172846 RepID=A0AAV4MYP6_CAEEX|nr:zinc finger homeobox protein 4 [Caerostris extrusa]
MCNVSVRTKVHLIQHVNTLVHLRAENLRQIQGESEPDMRDIFIVKEAKQATGETLKKTEVEDKDTNNRDNVSESKAANDDHHKNNSKNSDSSMLKQALLDRSANSENGNTEASVHTCPFCNYTSSSEVHIQMHVVSQHSQKPSTLACPLCQDGFRDWDVLENHLIDTHHVNKEGVKRLLALVDKTEWMAEMETSKQNEKTTTAAD